MKCKSKNCDRTMSWSKVILIEYIKQPGHNNYYENVSKFCSRACVRDYINNDD